MIIDKDFDLTQYLNNVGGERCLTTSENALDWIDELIAPKCQLPDSVPPCAVYDGVCACQHRANQIIIIACGNAAEIANIVSSVRG